MKVYSVNFTDGKEWKTEQITVPDSPTEITLLQWCTVQDIPVPAVLLPDEEKEEIDLPQGLTSWFSILDYVRKVLAVFSVEESKVLNADFSELTEEQGDGILAMFIGLVTVVNGYRPKFREQFKHHGRTFTFPENVPQSFGQVLIGGKLSMGQAADALQLDQALSATGPDGEPVLEDQKYKRDLAIVSALSREIVKGEPETPPLDWIERRAWLDLRMEDFADLPMDVALDGCFFLSSLKARLVGMTSSALRLRTSLQVQQSPVQ